MSEVCRTHGISIGSLLCALDPNTIRNGAIGRHDTFDASECLLSRRCGTVNLITNHGLDDSLDLRRRTPGDGARRMLPSAQRPADVKPVSDAVLTAEAWPHTVAAVVKELALKQGAVLRAAGLAVDGVGLEQRLDLFERVLVEDRVMLGLKPFAAVMDFAEVDPVLLEIAVMDMRPVAR